MNPFVQLALIAALSIVSTGRVSQALGANYSWNVASGNYYEAAEWYPSTVPGPADAAWVANGGTCNIGAFVIASCGTLSVGEAASGTVQLVDSLTVGAGGELIGDNGSGTFNQMYGTNSATSFLSVGHNASGSGSYILSGGLLTVGSVGEYIGDNGNGSFNQTAGTNSTSGQVVVGNNPGSNGSYNLGGSGYFAVPNLFVGNSSTGTLTQTGGALSVSSSLNLGNNTGGSGSYSLGGGLLTVGNGGECIGDNGNGSFNQTAGTNATSGQVAVGNNARQQWFVQPQRRIARVNGRRVCRLLRQWCVHPKRRHEFRRRTHPRRNQHQHLLLQPERRFARDELPVRRPGGQWGFHSNRRHQLRHNHR